MTAEHPEQEDTPTSARLVGVGTAVPPVSYSQPELLELFGVSDPVIRSVFLNSAIERRGLTLPTPLPGGPGDAETQGELLAKHTREGLRMGREAVLACLADAGREVTDVRHLCCVTSTGFLTPGFSALLLKDMGVSTTCSRLDVVGMGCNAGLNALSAVAAWSRCHPGELAVMVCIEVCSAAYVFDGTLRTSVVNSLFGDGAAAVAVISGAPDPVSSGPRLLRFASRTIPEAVDAMRYDWDDDRHRFSFGLDPQVPYVVGAHAEESLGRLLDGTGVTRSEVSHWVVHAGGKKVVDSVRVNLGLSRHDVRHTIGVLRDHGNLSSGSFLFSYQRLAREGGVTEGDVGVLMTMGPGSTVEMALARW
ncbi:3,5-dihydroxyphenylacetyl-CoA synthase DpgA [Streptomyces griseoaurantiacus]|uniref:3,5-dihydroxyphenylacetyl-CoA synthase DpgA n=1 Tax=Streptomyces griseoaurantiacus TaxID=68213 RepID=UPI002E2A7D51|nr:3,5-dihydroxyphenylacetyl-CoA synthase DpgA [Streptomyces jietaisiensis]WTI27221.1 type III polyketide synthase [Streptomyces jietaisiensis]